MAEGSIAVDKLADFVMPADDPHTMKLDAIKDIRIVQTVVDGEPTYNA